jgi:hypothetical protein
MRGQAGLVIHKLPQGGAKHARGGGYDHFGADVSGGALVGGGVATEAEAAEGWHPITPEAPNPTISQMDGAVAPPGRFSPASSQEMEEQVGGSHAKSIVGVSQPRCCSGSYSRLTISKGIVIFSRLPN